jgi:3-oxoacid CoA-transferase
VYALHVDYLAEGYRADRLGNVQFRGGSQNFNPSFAKAARVAIVEVDEIVEPGEIVPELIDLTGIFVSRVVKTTHAVDGKARHGAGPCGGLRISRASTVANRR